MMLVKTASDLILQKKDNGRVYFGRDGYLFSMEQIDESQEQTALNLTADFLRRIKASHPEIRVSVLLAPTASRILTDRLPNHALVSDQKTALGLAEDLLAQSAPDVVFTDPTEVLLRASSAGEQVYYRTDHHWTTDGAYAAYEAWARDNGFSPAPRSQFTRHMVSDSFYGTHRSKAPGFPVPPDQIFCYTPTSSDPEENAEEDLGTASEPSYRVTLWKDAAQPEKTVVMDSLFDESYLLTTDQYSYFLGGNHPQVLVQTPVKNGRRLLLIKDSYANCMVPFLALHFEEILITDLRYSHGKLLEGESIQSEIPGAPFTDLLILYNIDSYCSDKNLAYLMQLQF